MRETEKRFSQIYHSELVRLGDPEKVRLSFREEMQILIKPKHHTKAMKLFRRRQNFLKHADKDPDAEMDELAAKELALVIFFTIHNFRLLVQRLTVKRE